MMLFVSPCVYRERWLIEFLHKAKKYSKKEEEQQEIDKQCKSNEKSLGEGD